MVSGNYFVIISARMGKKIRGSVGCLHLTAGGHVERKGVAWVLEVAAVALVVLALEACYLLTAPDVVRGLLALLRLQISTIVTSSMTNQRKTGGKQLKGKIFSALFHTFSHFFTHFHTFSHFFRIYAGNYAPGLS